MFCCYCWYVVFDVCMLVLLYRRKYTPVCRVPDSMYTYFSIHTPCNATFDLLSCLLVLLLLLLFYLFIWFIKKTFEWFVTLFSFLQNSSKQILKEEMS